MVFISGPRQSGKTTFAQSIMKNYSTSRYLDWDIAGDRKKILSDAEIAKEFIKNEPTTSLVVLDEIHKFSNWKNLLKGLYDQHKKEAKILVTGSGRLDFYKKGKDSLAGRYYLFWETSKTNREKRIMCVATTQRSLLYFDFELNVLGTVRPSSPLHLFMKKMRHEGHWLN